jgi:hypothetical protein
VALVFFVLFFSAALAALHGPMPDEVVPVVAPPLAEQAEQTEQAEQPEPFDITLSASGPAPPDESAFMDVPPSPDAALQKLSLFPKILPPVLDISVKEAVGKGAAADKNSRAAHQAKVAQKFMRRNNVKTALRFQHRAVGLAPGNMLYRLDLAIMLDSADDKKGVSELYRQVVRAYDRHDGTLPPQLNIGDIRRRLSYLDSGP